MEGLDIAIEECHEDFNDINFDIRDEDEADEAIEKFNKYLEKICDYSFKIIEKRRKPNLIKSKEIKRLSELTDSYYRKWKRLLNTNEFLAEDAHNEFLKAKNNLKNEIVKHKTKSWKEFCSEPGLEHAYKLNKIIKMSLNRKPFSSVMKQDGTFTSSVHDTLSELINQFYPDKNHPKIDQQDNSNNQCIIELDVKELKKIIMSFSNKKAPGIDGITADIIKSLPDNILDELVKLYEALLRIGYFPQSWKIGKVIPIPKPNSNHKKTPKDFRPITLLSLFGKILEKIICAKLDEHTYANNLAFKNQYGFTRQKSTIDALHNLRNYIEKGILNRKSTLIVSKDITGAFNNACWKLIIDKLISNNYPSYIISCLKSYFDNRKVIISHGDVQIQKLVNQGCPQGSVLAPALWNILFKELFYKLETMGLMEEGELYQAFADDSIFAMQYDETEDGIKNVENKMNNLIEEIMKWGKNNYLEFNPKKNSNVES